VWAPKGKGKGLFFIDGKGMLTSVSVDTASAFVPGKPIVLFPAGHYFVNVARNYDIAPDGSRFVFVKTLSPGATRPTFTVVTDWFEEVKARRGGPQAARRPE
jgi:hypothetical protein